MRLIAAMSGGVDSAVAAARAVDAGHEVTGVHLALVQGTHSGCCTPEDARDARRAADVLGIACYVWDLAERFKQDVVDDFEATYAAGETPNPCMRCNERIKFSAVLDRALALGFDGIVTGHHARLATVAGQPELRRSVDLGKDQSYVLGTLTKDQLRHAHFPLGDTSKTEVRREAAARGLGVAEKPDSHDVCFVGKGGTGDWLRRRIGEAPGPILDEAGNQLGSHDGAFAFTVGQRRGVPIGGGTIEPRYVLSVSPVDRTVTVGPAASLDIDAIEATGSTYAGPEVRCQVQLRAHGTPIDAIVTPRGDRLEIRLAVPARGVAPGQAVVLYRPDAVAGDLVLGGARVTSTAQLSSSSSVATAVAEAPSCASSHSLTGSP